VYFKEKSMSKCRQFWVAFVALLLVALCLPCWGEGPKKQPSSNSQATETTLGVNPCGRPPKMVKGPRFYVWYEKGVWHLRTHTVSQHHTFTGTITVRGGKVVQVFNYAGMEAHAKKKKDRDFGLVSDKGKTIGFKMETKGKEDGFDFRLSKTVTAVTFDFCFDGYAHPEVICVGASCQAPADATFTLPGNPEKPIKKREKK
jgi:hypothetical protein